MPGKQSIASLFIDLAVSTADLMPSLKRSGDVTAKELERQTKDWNKRINRLFKTSKFIAGGITIGLALKGYSEFKHKVMEATEGLKELREQSQLIGIKPGNLQAIDLAAAQQGVNPEQAASGIQNLQQQIQEAADGNKKANEVFQSIGLNAQKLQKENTYKAYSDVAESISKIGNASKRSALSVQLFYYQAGNLINATQGGADALNKIRSSLASHGALVTDAQIKSVGMLTNQFTAFSQTITDQFEVAIAKAVQSFINSKNAMQLTEKVMNETLDDVQRLGKEFDFLAAQIDKTIYAYKELNKFVDKGYSQKIKDELQAEHPGEKITYDQYGGAMIHPNQNPAMGKIYKSISGPVMSSQNVELAKNTVLTQKNTDAQNQNTASTQLQTKQRSDLQGVFESMNNELNTQLNTWQDWTSFALHGLDQIANAANGTNSQINNLGNSIAALDQAMGGNPKQGESNSSIIGDIFGTIGSAFGGFFANGGTIKRGTFGIVGEKGPEMVYAKSAAYHVIPMNGQQASTQTPHITQVFQGGVTHDQLRDGLAQTKQAAILGVLEATRRGGNFRHAIQN